MMRLRRFTSHLKQQDWFAVALDILVVVVGIYIGLQVNNLNEERKEREEEFEFMSRLLDDAVYNEQQIKNIISRHQNRAVMAKQALDVLLDPNVQFEDPALSMFHMLLSVDIASLRLYTGTYDELISSGKMGLLRDVKLKMLVQDEAGIHRFAQGSLENFRSIATSPIPYSWKHTTYSQGQTNFGQLPESYDFDTLREDKEFVGAINNSIGAVLSFIEYRQVQLVAVQKVKAYLHCKLKNEHCDSSVLETTKQE